MTQNRRLVVLYGSSLLIAGLETCLKASPEIELVRIQPAQSNPMQQLFSLRPDVIIFDSGDSRLGTLLGTTQLTRDNPGAFIIELDAANNCLTILSSQQQEVTKSEDIVEAIRKAGVRINSTDV